ncbi:Uncharacterised protein [uncultured archaeon]|nr:Uncharacterised protein [uncultured archaeon]
MKKLFPILLFMLLVLIAGQASGSYWFRVIDISPISMPPNSDANFTILVKGLGSSGAYVNLVFKNESEGIDVKCDKPIKYVFPAGVTKYNCSVKAGDMQPGNYSFVVDVAAKSAPSGKKTGYVEIVGTKHEKATGPIVSSSQEANPQEMNASGPQGSPSPGFALAVLALLAMSRKRWS